MHPSRRVLLADFPLCVLANESCGSRSYLCPPFAGWTCSPSGLYAHSVHVSWHLFLLLPAYSHVPRSYNLYPIPCIQIVLSSPHLINRSQDHFLIQDLLYQAGLYDYITPLYPICQMRNLLTFSHHRRMSKLKNNHPMELVGAAEYSDDMEA